MLAKCLSLFSNTLAGTDQAASYQYKTLLSTFVSEVYTFAVLKIEVSCWPTREPESPTGGSQSLKSP
jgi:hypothetical protein